jgi:hypothetical protein
VRRQSKRLLTGTTGSTGDLLSPMTDQLDEFRAALESGNPDEVNSTIERLENLEAEARAELFDAAFEMYRTSMMTVMGTSGSLLFGSPVN